MDSTEAVAATPKVSPAESLPFLLKKGGTKGPPRKPAKRVRKFTIEQAFSNFFEPAGFDQGAYDVERAMRCVAYLLNWSTDVGNVPLDGVAANGLARILDLCADDLARRGRHPA